MHVMLDFETLGSSFDTCVVSLGAVAFNRSGVIDKKLFEFKLEDQVRQGRTFTASTLEWWMIQSDNARKVFKPSDAKVTIEEFLPSFEKFCDDSLAKVGESRNDLKPWGNGANFDIVIIEDLFKRHHPLRDASVPWKFWNVWCFRTFNNIYNCKKLVARPHGTAHSALDDALFQTDCVMAVWKQMDTRKKAGAT